MHHQKGAMNKIIKIYKKNELQNIGGCSLNEQGNNNLNISENNNREIGVVSDRIMLTILVSVASTKKSFSKLKIIKTYLRSTIS